MMNEPILTESKFQIERITFHVVTHFCDSSHEKISDKLIHLMEEELQNNPKALNEICGEKPG